MLRDSLPMAFSCANVGLSRNCICKLKCPSRTHFTTVMEHSRHATGLLISSFFPHDIVQIIAKKYSNKNDVPIGLLKLGHCCSRNFRCHHSN